ncbi:hypothetical protein [Devosia sp. XK-2]|uniref:hypothetical protein n=1 Tax=Devosia sp. XK-2 TaxID=3126689 RepID=UPI0030CEE229
MDGYDPERNRAGDVVPWASVRADYEAGQMTCNGIAHRYKLHRGQLDRRARANKWVRPGSREALDRQLLVGRLMGLLERQMDMVEAEMDNGNRAESKVLSDLVRDLDKLIALERAEARPAGSSRNPGEASELRRKLEERINAITKGMI